MPVVPRSLNVEPVYNVSSINISANDSSDGYNNNYINGNINGIVNVSEEQLEEITHTLRVDMMSDSSLNNVNAHELSTSTLSSVASNPTIHSSPDSNSLFGVLLVDERVSLSARNAHNSNDQYEPYYKNAIILGSIVLPLSPIECNGQQLRNFLSTQLPIVPKNFTFLSKEGWPLLKNQETKVNASNLINSFNIIAIRKTFDKPRVGIVNTNADCIGFIFIDYLWSLRQLRDVIDGHLRELGAKAPKFDYKFIERNGWPVTSNQEVLLGVYDILSNHCICIQTGSLNITSIITPCTPADPQIPDYSTNNPPITYVSETPVVNTPRGLDQIDSVPEKKSWKKGSFNVTIRQTTRRKQEKTIRIKSMKSTAKPIMLSYARQEAAKHALDLKKELVSLGFSVYLDVHEIQTGSDWQDSLNDAVRSCEVFVPLVTPMYGKTQWTNREVKLADLLQKYIIPINFIDNWPPECLAIQFATTQYIHWRPTEGEHDTPIDKSFPDIKMWPPLYLDRVSKLIADYINVKFPKPEAIKSKLRESRVASYPPITDVDSPLPMIKDNECDKQLIVISAHPAQEYIVSQLKTILNDCYKIWCSTDLPDGLLDEDNYSPNSPPFTPSQLPTISEENESIFSANYKDIARKIVEARKQRPVSLPQTESNALDIKKSLTRMMSQTSEISNYSSLTPDKKERLKSFQEKVSSASVVLIVASEAYYKSRTSQQHVYYCEHRKKMILIRTDQSQTPCWFSMLMAQDSSLSLRNPRFNDLLLARIKRMLDPQARTPNDEMHESKMQYLINFMKKNLPVLETCVYVVGSTKLQNPRSEEICKAIGAELAKVKNVTVVTSGFYGAGDLVASAFDEVRKNNRVSVNVPINENNSFEQMESSVVHIVPVKDSEDFSGKGRQNTDGSFEPVPYGKTIFLGESVKERESAVARLLDTCILIEGGPGSAREIEEFIWNDHFVIPVISSGGAASGKYGIPIKIFEAPHGVSEQDWSKLSAADALPIDVAKAIVRIICSLKEAIVDHALSRLDMQSKTKPKLMRSRSTRKRYNEKRKVDITAAQTVISGPEDGSPNSPEKILPIIKAAMTSRMQAKSSKWKRLISFNKKD